jgi:phosphoenolpyruvate synthase/pyruvate phosphate dikinase
MSLSEAEKLMDKLNVPLKNNFYKQEEYDLLRTKNLKLHVKRYEWINSRYGDLKPYTVNQARKKLTNIDKKQFLKNWRKQKSLVVNAIADAKRLLSAKDRVVVDFMQYIVYYRTQRTDIMNQAQYLYAPKLKALARQKRLTYQELLYCTKGEVLGKVPTRNVLRQRMKNQGTILEDSRVYCVTGHESERIRKLLSEGVKRTNEIRGKVAYSGHTKGKARLIFDAKDFFRLKRGEILITSMTSPHMVPIMKKAAAFVTDEGGITCHAAIMSRELKKPCVIGTKIATQIFKDGDLVDVDANRGIVKIIKRAAQR